MSDERSLPGPSRMFHAMVIMGGSLAMNCGGQVDPERKIIADENAASGGGGTRNGPTPLDPDPFEPSVPVEPGPWTCPPAQWDCSAGVVTCSDHAGAEPSGGYRLPDDCLCDPTAPRTRTECAPDESFVCRHGVADAAGRPFTRSVPFECSCIPRQDSCSDACILATVAGQYVTCVEDAEGAGGAGGAAPSSSSVLCGCAYTFILR